MGIPRIGSLGLTRDMWALTHAGCYGHPERDVPEHIEERFRLGCTEAPLDWDGTVPFDPACKPCRQAAKRVMEKRGLTREQVKRCFEFIGAKWEWTSRESDVKRRESDRGEMVIESNGNVTTDLAIKARQRKQQRRIEHQDRMADRMERKHR